MSVILDARPHATAIRTALDAQLDPWLAFDYGEVPGSEGVGGTMPRIFAVVGVERMYLPPRRMPAKSGVTGWRASVRVVARTVNEARWAMFQVATALNEVQLEVGSDLALTTPIQPEDGERAPAPDDGRFSATSFWTYAL